MSGGAAVPALVLCGGIHEPVTHIRSVTIPQGMGAKPLKIEKGDPINIMSITLSRTGEESSYPFGFDLRMCKRCKLLYYAEHTKGGA